MFNTLTAVGTTFLSSGKLFQQFGWAEVFTVLCVALGAVEIVGFIWGCIASRSSKGE